MDNKVEERITYLEPDSDIVDEVVLDNCLVHLKCQSDNSYMLIVSNNKHHWSVNIYSQSGRAHVIAKVYDEINSKSEVENGEQIAAKLEDLGFESDAKVPTGKMIWRVIPKNQFDALIAELRGQQGESKK